jgi:siroheme synthase
LTMGLISLVGSGPGDPELVTLKMVRRLACANLVFYDALVSKDVLKLAPQARRLLSANDDRITARRPWLAHRDTGRHRRRSVDGRDLTWVATLDRLNALLVSYSNDGRRTSTRPPTSGLAASRALAASPEGSPPGTPRSHARPSPRGWKS